MHARSLKQSIETARQLLKRLNEIRNLINQAIEQHGHYLEEGTYHISFEEKIVIYQKSKEIMLFLKNNTNHLNRESLAGRKRLTYFFRSSVLHLAKPGHVHIKKAKTNISLGQLMMLTYYGDIKLFDFKHRLVWNKVDNKEEFIRRRETFETFSPYFPTLISAFVEEDQLVVEKLASFTPFNLWDTQAKEDIVHQLLEMYDRYLAAQSMSSYPCKSVSEVLAETDSIMEGRASTQYLKESISDEAVQAAYPVIRIHGDFCLRNILLENGQLYLIDWETTRDSWFFHDLLYLFLKEGKEGDLSFLQHFFSGEYDQEFDRMFSYFNLTFSKKDKPVYLMLTVLEKMIQEHLIEKEVFSEVLSFDWGEYKEIMSFIIDYPQQIEPQRR